jgi:uncharacterized protein YndB with AHSA1/START domain
VEGDADVKDLLEELDRVRRTVRTGDEHVVSLQRTYDAPPEDVWDAVTNPERIPRWFLPVSGDLRLGGRFQLEGNAGGEIRVCDPPKRLTVTWEARGDTSLLSVTLAPAGDATELTLEHAVGDNEHWATFGPGAVGVGWDMALLGLALEFGGAERPQDAATDPRLPEFSRRSAKAWGQAHLAGGADEEVARAMAERTSEAYAPSPT